jgi:hypothetical protein
MIYFIMCKINKAIWIGWQSPHWLFSLVCFHVPVLWIQNFFIRIRFPKNVGSGSTLACKKFRIQFRIRL